MSDPEASRPRADLSPPAGRGDAARQQLIHAGLQIYAKSGFEGASTRALAKAAGANIAAIPYYFGGKEGLYLAVVDFIVDYYRQHLIPQLGAIKAKLDQSDLTLAARRELLRDFVNVLVPLVLQDGEERALMSRIISREQLDPTSAFDRLYLGFIRDLNDTLCALIWPFIAQRPTHPKVKLVAQSLLGQVAFFRTSREAVLKTMGWPAFKGKQIDEICTLIGEQADAIIRHHESKGIVS